MSYSLVQGRMKALVLLAVAVATSLPAGVEAEEHAEQKAQAARQIVLSEFEATARGFPSLLDLNGNPLADGDFAQWLEGERLRVRIIYQFKDGRRIEETGAFHQKPHLVQHEWTWVETRNGVTQRKFAVNFGTQQATADKREGGKLKQWSEKLDHLNAGQTFAGFGFTLAIKGVRERLIKGGKVELQAVGFTPKPRLVSVEISYGGLDRVQMGGRALTGERFLIHPRIPKIAKLFIEVPDTRIWLTSPRPAGFLRWEGTLVEPDDPIVRVDLLPGGKSGRAASVAVDERSTGNGKQNK